MQITANDLTGITQIRTSGSTPFLLFNNDKYYSKTLTDDLTALNYYDSPFLSLNNTRNGYFSDHIEMVGNQQIDILLRNLAVETQVTPGTQAVLYLWYAAIYQTAPNQSSGLITQTTHGNMISRVRCDENFNVAVANVYFQNYATNTTAFPNTAIRITSIGAAGDRDGVLSLRSFNYPSTVSTATTRWSFCGHIVQDI